MTIHSLPLTDIKVRPDRQRQHMDQEELMSLADSIRRLGLINPILIEPNREGLKPGDPTESFFLIAGERRYRAHQLLGRTHIDCLMNNALNYFQRQELELEENLKRTDLTWQETAKAVDRYHAMRLAQDPEWTQEKTGAALGMLPSTVSKYITVQTAMLEKPELAQAQSMSTVANLVARTKSREMDDILESALSIELDAQGEVIQSTAIIESLTTHSPNEGMASARPAHNLLNGNFLEEVQDWQFPKFNLIHCDFPYGVNMDTSPLHGGGTGMERYADSPEIYFQLLAAFFEHQDAFIAQSAHCVFWFSMKFYSETVDAFRDAGWSVNPMPLVWAKEDLKGILPDPNRGPRQCYETALLATRGDRKIVRPVANLKIAPTTKDTGHLSEKPLVVVESFLRMLIDENTSLLDPTCGSGTAIRAAKNLGARIALGIEQDLTSFEIAQRTLNGV